MKAIDQGVDYNFQPRMGDSKYSQKIKKIGVNIGTLIIGNPTKQ
jgi:hypothetical protein